MGVEKLVCSNCRGNLKWNPKNRTFVCESCGTIFQTDNEFTYRYVNESDLERAREESRDKEHKRKMEIWKFYVMLGLLVLSFLMMNYGKLFR